jgi:autotransporter-associated beta strand protein
VGAFGTYAAIPNIVNPGAQSTVWSSVYGTGTLEERVYCGCPHRDGRYAGTGAFLDPIATFPGLLTQAPIPTGLLNITANFTTARGFVMNAQGGINVNANITLTHTGVISTGLAFSPMNGGLTKTGTGTLLLNTGNNTYDGPTAIRAGVLEINSISNGGVAGRLGDSSNAPGNLWLDGGTLRYNGAAPGSTDRGITITTAGGTIENNSATANTLTFTNTGAVQLFNVGARTFTLQGTNAGNNLFRMSLGDNGGATTFNKNGYGTWVLDNPNTYTGATNLNLGTLKSGVNDLLPDTGTVLFNGATLDLQSFQRNHPECGHSGGRRHGDHRENWRCRAEISTKRRPAPSIYSPRTFSRRRSMSRWPAAASIWELPASRAVRRTLWDGEHQQRRCAAGLRGRHAHDGRGDDQCVQFAARGCGSGNTATWNAASISNTGGTLTVASGTLDFGNTSAHFQQHLHRGCGSPGCAGL